MDKSLENICDYQFKKNELVISGLNELHHTHSIDLDAALALIDGFLNYYVIHNINAENVYEVAGDRLSEFLINYIEPESGDGLDMCVFNRQANWCLCFDIDGSIILKD